MQIKKFYYIDSQPFSHSGKEVYLREDGINGFSNPNFIPYVEKEFFKKFERQRADTINLETKRSFIMIKK